MNPHYWGVLGLERARLADIERQCGPFDPEIQPRLASVHIIDPAREIQKTHQMVERLRAQEPVDRIINALLFSAVKEGARRLTIEPDAMGIRVLHTVGEREREHLHLPTTTLEPMLDRFRQMAKLETGEQKGSFQIEVETRLFRIHVEFHHTSWGERVEIAFAAVPNAAA